MAWVHKGARDALPFAWDRRTEAVCCIPWWSTEEGSSEPKTSWASHLAAAQIHSLGSSKDLSLPLPLNMPLLGKLRPQVSPTQECSLLVTIERPKQINLGVNPL